VCIVVLASVPAFVVVPALAFVLTRLLLYSMELLLGLVFVVVGTRRVGICPCWHWCWPVRSSVGTGRCWSSAVALVVAFVPVRAGVDVDPFCLLIGAGVVLVDRLYSVGGGACAGGLVVLVSGGGGGGVCAGGVRAGVGVGWFIPLVGAGAMLVCPSYSVVALVVVVVFVLGAFAPMLVVLVLALAWTPVFHEPFTRGPPAAEGGHELL
jgi:hypothetical protein